MSTSKKYFPEILFYSEIDSNKPSLFERIGSEVEPDECCNLLSLKKNTNVENFSLPRNKKLFITRAAHHPEPTGSTSNDKLILAVKNKYLYSSTEGAANYLLANNSKNGTTKRINRAVSEEILKKIKSTKDTLEGLRSRGKEKIATLNLFFLGPGDGIVEVDLCKKIQSEIANVKVNVVLIDVSIDLLQLAIKTFHQEDHKEDHIVNNYRFICSDFFDLDMGTIESVKDHIEGVGHTNLDIFLMLGGTFANYLENELLMNIFKFMPSDSLLICDYNIKKTDEHGKLHDRENVFGNYDNFNSWKFVTSTLRLLPRFKGYVENYRSPNMVFSINEGDEVLITDFSDIKNSSTYAPHIRIPNGDKEKTSSTVYCAFSSRYVVDEVNTWIQDKVKAPITPSGNMKPGWFGLIKTSPPYSIQATDKIGLIFLQSQIESQAEKTKADQEWFLEKVIGEEGVLAKFYGKHLGLPETIFKKIKGIADGVTDNEG